MSEEEAKEEKPKEEEAKKGDEPVSTGPIEPVQKPDRKEFEKKVEALNVDVAGLDKKIKETDGKITQAKSYTGDQSDEVKKARADMKALKEEKDGISKERQEMIEKQKDAKGQLDTKMQQQKSLKAELKYSSPEEIDKRIAELEKKQATTSMTLRDEKNLLKEIEQLKQSKKKVSHLASSNDSIASDKKMQASLSERIKEKSQKLEVLRSKMDKVKKVLDKLYEANSERRAVLPALFKERDDLRKEKTAKIEEIKGLRSNYKAQNEKYQKYQKELKRQRDEAKRLEEEARKAEIEARRKQLEEEELKRIPYEEEMELCSYLIHFLETTYIHTSSTTTPNNSSENAAKTEDNDSSLAFEGMMPAGKIAEAKEEEFCALNKQFGKKKGRGKKKGGSKSSEKIMLVPKTIEIFGLLNLEPPATLPAVAPSIEALKDKKKYFETLPRGEIKSIREMRKSHDTPAPTEKNDASTEKKPKSNKNPAKKAGFNATEAAEEAFPQLPTASTPPPPPAAAADDDATNEAPPADPETAAS